MSSELTITDLENKAKNFDTPLSKVNISNKNLKETATNVANAVGTTGAVSGFFSYFNLDSGTVLKVFLTLMLLSVLGFNILVHLDEIGDTIGEVVRPITSRVLGTTGEVTKATIQTAAKGSKLGVDVVADTTTSGIDLLAESIDDGTNTVTKNNMKRETVNLKDRGVDNRIPVIPDDADSEVQQGGKAGFCYVGSDKGTRHCIQVGRDDQCMSGDIFPTREICINPNLRE